MHLIKNMSYLMCFYVYKIRDCMDQESQESDLGMCKMISRSGSCQGIST